MKALSYLLAANFEAVAIFYLTWQLGKYLNTNYPQSFNWFMATTGLGLVVIVHTWYIMFRSLMKSQERQQK